MNTQLPIIFIHYGNSDYLHYALKAAKIFNPDKRIILLGDQSNEGVKVFGVEHHYFEDYGSICELKDFEQYYRKVGGREFMHIDEGKGGRDWTKFNFKKWFVLYDFVLKNNISQFWTFDSDTLIVTGLSPIEGKFQNVDYTVMGNLHQLQGVVRNTDFILKFC